MNLFLGFSVSLGMLAKAGGTIFYEYARTRAGRLLSKNEAIAIPYWIAYLIWSSAPASCWPRSSAEPTSRDALWSSASS